MYNKNEGTQLTVFLHFMSISLYPISLFYLYLSAMDFAVTYPIVHAA